MANEFIIKNGLTSQGAATVNGNLYVTGCITGSCLTISGSVTSTSSITVNTASDPNINNVTQVYYSGSSGGGTIYLNSAINIPGYQINLVRISSTVSADISGTGGAQINGVSSKALPTALYSTTKCISNGVNWFCTNGTVL